MHAIRITILTKEQTFPKAVFDTGNIRWKTGQSRSDQHPFRMIFRLMTLKMKRSSTIVPPAPTEIQGRRQTRQASTNDDDLS